MTRPWNTDMVIVIDNYDSFVYKLAQYLGELGWRPAVFRNDEITLEAIERSRPSHIIISPGPCTPLEAGISNDVVRRFAGKVPILGVCLGHQCIAHVYGGRIAAAQMPTHGKSSLVYHDGRAVYAGLANPFEAGRYHSMDYGFLHGYGLFETMRAYGGPARGGYVFRLNRHLGRLSRASVSLGLAVDSGELAGAVEKSLAANGLGDARIRITVSAGEGGAVPDLSSCARPTVLVVAAAFEPLPQDVYGRGFRAILSSITRNGRSPLSAVKSTSFLESMMARQEARDAGVDEAICLNEWGMVAEASMSNGFVVVDGVLRPPGLDSGLLPGGTREAVLDLAAGAGIAIKEADITPDELAAADEALLTNSVMEIMPLTEFCGRPIGRGMPGVVTLRLMAAYRELVERETGVGG